MPPESPTRTSKYSLIGKYELIKHVATGGMGAVYRARDTETGREVALKVLPADKALKPVLIKRFEREALVGSKLQHDNLVVFYEKGDANGFYYLALEFIEGVDLHQYIHRKGKLDVRESKVFITQAAKALEYLHDQNIVHRDIKPSNFLVMAKDGRPLLKLIDLGLAKELDDDEARVTRDGTTLGTVDYMAPEQARDASAADVRADIYSLGCTWYHMLAGKPPFPEGSLAERLYKHVEVKPPDIQEINPNVTDDVVEILGRMLAKKPEDRYANPSELIRDLQGSNQKFKPISPDLLTGLATGTQPRSTPKPPPSTPELKRRPPRPSDADRPAVKIKKTVKSPAPRFTPLQHNLIVVGVVASGLFFLGVVLFLAMK